MNPRRLLLFVWCVAALSSGCTDTPQAPRVSGAINPAPVAFDPVQSIEPWTFAGVEGRVITTPSYRIFTTENAPLIRRRIPMFMELAAQHYSSALGELPRAERRMDTYILASRTQWAQLTRQMTGPRAETYLRIRAGGFAENGRALLFNIGSRNTFGTVAHEGWHQYTQSVFREALPIWLEEGIATYMEGYRWDDARPDVPRFLPWTNIDRFDRLREVVQGGRITPLDELLTHRPQDLLELHSNERALDYYAQIWALVHFLREGENARYREALARILRDAAAGHLSRTVGATAGPRAAAAVRMRTAGREVFITYIDEDIPAVESAFRTFMREATRTGARDAIVAGRSPLR